MLRRNLQRALRDRKPEDAHDILRRLQEVDPLSRETRGLELEYLLLAGRLDEASSLAGQLVRQFPDSGRILFFAGRTAYARKEYASAARLFEESNRVYASTQTRYWKAKALSQAGHMDEAEALFVALKPEVPAAELDLAWIHERRGDLESALAACERYLEKHPANEFARAQQARIKARMLDPDALIEEVSGLEELGEAVSDAVLPEFVRSLFESGQALRARAEIEQRLPAMNGRSCLRVGWVCYRAGAWDLACILFLRSLAEGSPDYKTLNALESAARRSGREQEVADAYAAHAARFPQLYGRRRSLLRRPV